MFQNFKTKKFWTDGTGSIFLAIFVALFIRWAFVEAYVIPSGSMLPTLLIHDHIFVNKFVFGLRVPFSQKFLFKTEGPQSGDIVVFKSPQKLTRFFIKRVVGTPGDKVYYEEGHLYVNDKLVEKRVPVENKSDFDWLRSEDFQGYQTPDQYVHWEEKLSDMSYSVILPKMQLPSDIYGPYIVPEGHYFMMGDNRANSSDSRRWDEDKRFVPYEYLVGRAMHVWLSCEETIPVVKFLCNPLTIRWKRFFHSVH